MTDRRELAQPGRPGDAIRAARLRAGLTQVQLARAISRSGKFVSELESGKARVSQADLERLAAALSVTCDALTVVDRTNGERHAWDLNRRVRDPHPIGMTVMTFAQLLDHLDRCGWLRSANLWMIGAEPFPEENDLALVEHLASLVADKNVSLRYVYGRSRLDAADLDRIDDRQGSVDALPPELVGALRWSQSMRPYLDPACERVIGYALEGPLPLLSRCHTLAWLETQDVSWSDVMPLLYCRGVTRTFENPNDSAAYWTHLPRSAGSKLLLELAQRLGRVSPHPARTPDTDVSPGATRVV